MLDTSASGGSKHAVVALGNFPTAEAAARAHDLALRCAVGDAAHTNFSVAELHVEDEVELEDGTVLHGVCRSGGAGSGCARPHLWSRVELRAFWSRRAAARAVPRVRCQDVRVEWRADGAAS